MLFNRRLTLQKQGVERHNIGVVYVTIAIKITNYWLRLTRFREIQHNNYWIVI
ncbi:hypothetical protein MGSAQ_001122 [marine sediment metagenome]|uniref:Uncharacterized protein n=1 Tax=marine sediment metagenome TaxID=412755 RepID=A0A1B6NWN6_9ZZZZ